MVLKATVEKKIPNNYILNSAKKQRYADALQNSK